LVAPADVDDYHITTASNAEIELDGLMIQRSSNEFNDVLEGVEMSIQAVDLSSPQTTTFTVSADTDAIKANLQEFVDSYNAVVDFLNQQSSYDQESGTGGDLFGDSVLSSVRRITHDPLFQVDISSVVGDTLGYSTLGLLGIDLGTDGRLTIDETKLDQKMADNLDAFSDFFTDSDGFDNGGAAKNTPGYYTDTTADSGAFAKLFRSIDQAVKSVTLDGDPDDPSDNLLIKGLFGRRKETFKSNIDRINKQIDALELRLEDYEESLVLRFSALEELMAGLNSQSSFLNSLNL
jgi:flagellar hook-associated protein 2